LGCQTGANREIRQLLGCRFWLRNTHSWMGSWEMSTERGGWRSLVLVGCGLSASFECSNMTYAHSSWGFACQVSVQQTGSFSIPSFCLVDSQAPKGNMPCLKGYTRVKTGPQSYRYRGKHPSPLGIGGCTISSMPQRMGRRKCNREAEHGGASGAGRTYPTLRPGRDRV